MDPTEMRQRRTASTVLACLAVTCLLFLLLLASVAPVTLMLVPVAVCWTLLFGGLALLVAPRRAS